MGSEWVENRFETLMSEPVRNGIYKKKEFHGRGAKIVNMGELFGNPRLFDIEMKRVELTEKEIPKTLLCEGDLLFARRSLTAEGAGKCTIVKEVKEETTFESSIIRVRPDVKKVDSDFLFYFFSSPHGKYLIGSILRQVAVSGITGSDLKQLSIPTPPLSEQKSIAHILGTLDDKIELNRQMNATLESMAQALFKSWFVDFDPVIDNALAAGNPIPEPLQAKAETRKSLGDKRKPLLEEMQKQFPSCFVFSEEMGWIPEGWKVCILGDEFHVTMGQSPPGNTYNEIGEGMPFFQGRADFGFRYPSNRVYCTSPKRLASKGDTLVSVRAPVGDVNMAAENCCIGRGVSASRHQSGSRSYTYYAMLQLREHFKVYEAEGTVFGSINQKDFKALPQLRTPVALVHDFESYAGTLDTKIELGAEAINYLTRLRDTLLPNLLSGELRIPDAEKLVADSV